MEASKMVYRMLGNTGLKVSVLSWGNWINTKGGDITFETVKLAFENGINFFDTAEIYGAGEGEKSLGEALKKLGARREDLVVSTKLLRCGNGPNDVGLSRKHIVEGMNNSLKRLQLDYVDVVFCHRFDDLTDVEEVCKSMNLLIDQGKAFFWGTSEWKGTQIMDAIGTCKRLGLIPPTVEQCQYNLFARDKMESEFPYLFNKFNLATTIWSPLMSGILTGKYIDETPTGSRFDVSTSQCSVHYNLYTKNKPLYDEKLKNLKKVAERLGCSLTQLSLAWAIRNPNVTTCILGSSKVEQLQENLKAVEIMSLLTNEVDKEIEEICQSAPQGDFNWRLFVKYPNHRHKLLGMKMD